VILWRLALTNRTSASRDCAVTGYVEWTLGDTRERTAPHIVTRLDERGVLLATNPIRESGGERVAFFQISERDGRACADRGLFLGRNGRYDSPAGLAAPTLPQRVGAGLDPCGAIQTRVSVAAGETHELVFAIGEAAGRGHRRVACGRALLTGGVHVGARASEGNVVPDHWRPAGRDSRPWVRRARERLAPLPDPQLSHLGPHGVLPIQRRLRVPRPVAGRPCAVPVAARHRARAPAASSLASVRRRRRPALVARANGHGVRTHFSDDRLWLVYASMQYADATGDTGVFDEVVPFIAGRLLGQAKTSSSIGPRRPASRPHCTSTAHGRSTAAWRPARTACRSSARATGMTA
jgi:cyclic beta-1,2-glucan synthetase